jgi:hypothetical protein
MGIGGLALAFIISNFSRCAMFHIWIWLSGFEKDLN